MSYLGNTPAARFSAMAKQTITGDGGTGYTLTHAVGNEQEIEVFVNNVRQEPGSGKAYTVSGTTLTMTGNVASTDEFYVVYQGKAQQTATHPPTFPLTATTGTFSGDLTVDTSTLKVDSTNNRVGIGSASPLSDLSVESSIGGVLTLSTSDTTGTSGDSLGKIDFYSGDTSTGSTGVQARISGVYDSNGDSTALTFTTGTSTGSGSPTIAEHLRITSTGKVETSNRDFGFFNHGTNVTLADDASIVINGTVAGCGLLALYDTASGTNGLYRIGYGSCAGLSAQGAVGQATANTDGSICVFSSGHTITIKNRTGITRGFTLAMFMAGNNFAG
jgi:hypothetical protein